MLPIRLQVILIVFSSISMLFSLKMIRKFQLDLKYALLWLVLNSAILVLAAYPPLLLNLAKEFAIEIPANALFLFGIVISMSIIFSLTVALSRTSYKIKMISQELGILKEEVQRLKKGE
ncbi:DUF2304 domain-containing protein [Pelosinus sp. IPA-1]|uniref:DUF2304 domain-containing protein n=1 Tax=Pelosinus sp. IPA-1 TaxID=3029569 RepID=UPI0024361FD4|nr:DUF2304 domain-containing protein [Pelosinus sp. IPA-1]GMB01248.1 hypothetical protein PIPA1_40470 [Pelosinus sp. IPA-1]